MDTRIIVQDIVLGLCETLEIKQTQLARMLKINDSSISNNMNKSIDDIKYKKTGKRLLPLFLVVSALNDELITSCAIIEGINEPTIPNIQSGMKESVLQSIQSGSLLNPSLLIEKARAGVDQYRRKKERANKRAVEAVSTALYA